MVSGLTGWHLMILLLWLVPLTLWIVALVQIGQSRAPGGTIAAWLVLVTLVPLVGAILWFTIGRRTAMRATSAAPASGVAPPAGWYASPSASGTLQWWDGTRWTEHVKDGPE